jgi:hypothetical protein
MQINEDAMVVSKYAQMNFIPIWEPRYHDKKILINPAKVGEHNKIKFTKAPSLPGEYYLSGKTIKKSKKESNGTIDCYAVDVAELRPLQINKRDWREVF